MAMYLTFLFRRDGVWVYADQHGNPWTFDHELFKAAEEPRAEVSP